MSGDDIVERLRHVAWLAEEGSEVVDLATTAADEIVRLRAEREDIDLLHVPCTDDDLTFCHECVGGWPCRTHLLLHPEEARRG